jgi:hypothetical protein
LTILDPPLDTTAVGLKSVSQHDDNGFFVGSGVGRFSSSSTVTASELGSRIAAMLDQ